MLARLLVLPVRRTVMRELRRHIGVTAACSQVAAPALDPIQKLFLDKVKDYAQKVGSSGDALLDATPDTSKAMSDALEKVTRQYNAEGKDLARFPTFTFADVPLQPVGVDMVVPEEVIAEEIEEEDDDKPYFDI